MSAYRSVRRLGSISVDRIGRTKLRHESESADT